MVKNNAELIVDARALHGEGPVWDADGNVLYWIDGMGCKIHRYDRARQKDAVVDIGQDIGCLVLLEKGGLAAALKSGFCFLDITKNSTTPIKNPVNDAGKVRFNDGKCDRMGRFWAGTMALDEKTPCGELFCMDGKLEIKRMLQGVTISNGMAWNKDNTVMYYIDSPTLEVSAFDFDLQSGAIENRRAVVRIPEGEGIPDGMTIDEEGMLWVAQWGGFKVSRWNPQTGEKLGEVVVPAECVSCCTFGGENLDELYITTATMGSSPETLEKYPHAGGLFLYRPGVRGVAADKFTIG